MSLEKAIHERWGTDFLLSAALPVERLSTGAARGDTTLPYAILTRRESRVLGRTSSGTETTRSFVRLSVWSADLDQAKNIAQLINHRFDRVEFPLVAGRVLNMQREQNAQEQADDGSWRLDLDYVVITDGGM